MITRVELSRRAEKDLLSVPLHIAIKLRDWRRDVETLGLEEVRKIPGFHDEPLKGKRLGQRSVRLNRDFRAIYVIKKNGVEFVSIEEVNKHDY